MEEAMIAEAPWTPAEVERLRQRQAYPGLHPYTCGNNSEHHPLEPTVDGWTCIDCDYTQNWAHDFDAGRPTWAQDFDATKASNVNAPCIGCFICGDRDDHNGVPHSEAMGDGLTRYDVPHPAVPLINYLEMLEER